MRRRSFFQGFPLTALLGSSAAKAAPLSSLSKNRNLFTGDSCTFFYNPEIYHPEGLPYTAKAVHRYIDVLADNGVDTFLCNPNAQVAWYPSKKLQTIIDGYKRGDRNFFRAQADAAKIPKDQVEIYLDKQVQFFNLYLDLAEAGVDWLAESSKACRRRGIAPWVSVRMNDTHGSENPASHFNCALFRDPGMRLSGIDPDPQRGPHAHWMALNYAEPQVRDFMMSHIREYLYDYDFEGMELDWLRDPHCCEPNPPQRDIDTITSWIGQVREATEARARQIGKPYPLGLRIPANLGYLKSRGLDVKALVSKGFIDFLGFSNFWQTSWDLPYDELRRELGPDVVFYGVVEDAPNWVPGYAPSLATHKPDLSQAAHSLVGIRYMAASPQMQRANAAGKLAMGVHGIEQFNFFCTDQPRIPGLHADYSVLRRTHDLEFLRGKPKHYCLSTPSGWLSSLWEVPEQLPVTMESKTRREFRLSMSGEPPGVRTVVQVVTEKRADPVRLGVSVNGKWATFEASETRRILFPVGPYTEHVEQNTAWNFAVDAADFREGWNRFTLTNNSKGGPLKIVSLEIGVLA